MNIKSLHLLMASTLIYGITLATPLMAATDTDGDGVPDTAEPLLHTDQQNNDTDGDGLDDLRDDEPVFLANPQDQDGAAAPFAIQEVLVENNYDFNTRKDAPDHLELEVINNSEQPLNGFSIYYTIKDAADGKVEAYYQKLDGYILPAKGDEHLHFDTSGLPGHFRANPNSIYITSPTAKLFQIELKATGYKPVTASVNKDAGGVEEAD